MIIDDVIYGQFDVQERVTAELIMSQPMQRLKRVAQQGVPNDAVMPWRPHYSRFEHCVGTMLLLRKLGAPLEEQVSGLLHDVSHTAFSHVADWVTGREIKQDFQDSILKQYIMDTELGSILKRNGLDPEKVADTDRFPLLGRHGPELCADRVDYCLRDMKHCLHQDPAVIVRGLRSMNNEIVFDSKETAMAFGRTYMRCQLEEWASESMLVWYHLMSNALKAGIDAKIITMDDLMYKGDLDVVDMLDKSGNEKVVRYLGALRGSVDYKVERDGKIPLKTKLRFVDPKYIEDGALKSLIKNDAEFASMVEKERERTSKGMMVDIAFG